MTLAIIGVIASMTIPALRKNTQNKETVAQVKKAYSTLSNAVALAESNEGPIQYWGWSSTGSTAGAQNALDKISPYMNVQKNCGVGGDCWTDTIYKYFNGSNYYNFNTATNSANARLADGMFFRVLSHSSNCNASFGTSESLKHICGEASFDINGTRPPNLIGIDVFAFWVTRDGVVPIGTAQDTSHPVTSCRTQGWACAGWILAKENMDYLDGPVSW